MATAPFYLCVQINSQIWNMQFGSIKSNQRWTYPSELDMNLNLVVSILIKYVSSYFKARDHSFKLSRTIAIFALLALLFMDFHPNHCF